MPKEAGIGRCLTATASGHIDSEIAQLRGLGLEGLRARWRVAFRRVAPSHLSKHLLLAMGAYRLQADAMGDLDAEALRFLKQIDQAPTAQKYPVR